MKKLSLLVLALPLVMSMDLIKPDCGSLAYFKEGTQCTMTSYNEDGKITGSSKTVYQKVSKSAIGMAVTASQENFDKKGKSVSKNEYTLRCEKGILYFDLKNMMPQQQGDAYKDMEMTVEGMNKEMPSELKPGMSLKDANVKFIFKTKDSSVPMPMMNMEVKISNRKVEAIEKISTAAGTFECFKMSEDIETKTMFSVKMHSVSWFSLDAGTVKSMSYKENGKLAGYSELTELKH
ncbi:MAG TPA: hypothetical protein PLQ93_06855 [Bacteroidia bacterium]|nr:hypothetical protein [Bacteroidia bacterium]